MKPLATIRHRAGPWLILLGWIGIAIGLQVAQRRRRARHARHVLASRHRQPGRLRPARRALPRTRRRHRHHRLRVSSGTVTDPPRRAAIAALLDEIAGVPSVASVASPLAPEGAAQVSPDGTIAYATVTYDDARIQPAHRGHREGGRHRGQLPMARPLGTRRSPLAMAVKRLAASSNPDGGRWRRHWPAHRGRHPVLRIRVSARHHRAADLRDRCAYGVARRARARLHLSPISSSAPTLAVLLGLGIGIDYALFIVNRYRRELKVGTRRTGRRREGDRNVGPCRCLCWNHRVHRARRHVRAPDRVPQRPRHRGRHHRGVLRCRVHHARARGADDVRIARAESPRTRSPCRPTRGASSAVAEPGAVAKLCGASAR